MYWYDFGREDVYVGHGGKFMRKYDCKTVSTGEKEKIKATFATHLLKIYYTDQCSYDNSDDDRASDSYYSSASYVYRTVNLEQDLYGLALRDGEVAGVVFYIKNDRGDAYAAVFHFNGCPKNSVTMGYSASHSSSYTTICRVELVKRGENGVPEDAQNARFIQHERYPEL